MLFNSPEFLLFLPIVCWAVLVRDAPLQQGEAHLNLPTLNTYCDYETRDS